MGLAEHGDIGVVIFTKSVVNSPPLSTESEFLGNCFDHSERQARSQYSGFFVGRVCLQKRTL